MIERAAPLSEFIDEITAEHQTPVELTEPKPPGDHGYLIVINGPLTGELLKLSVDPQVIGRAEGSALRILDESVSRQHVSVVVDEKGKTNIIDLESRNGLYVNGRRVRSRVLKHGDKIQVGASTVLRFSDSNDALDEQFERKMFSSALRDGLTGTFNKRYFNERLATEFQFAQRHKAPLSVILLDVDQFKQINDKHGHLVGDHVLEGLAQRIQTQVRAEDVVARFGGDEFAVLSRGINLEQAAAFAERVRFAAASLEVAIENGTLSPTVSVGVAAMPHPKVDTPKALMALVDQALYDAKRTGRNRVKTAR